MIDGPDLAVLVGVTVLLLGAGQIPKLARSLGEARSQFHRGAASASDAAGWSPTALASPVREAHAGVPEEVAGSRDGTGG